MRTTNVGPRIVGQKKGGKERHIAALTRPRVVSGELGDSDSENGASPPGPPGGRERDQNGGKKVKVFLACERAEKKELAGERKPVHYGGTRGSAKSVVEHGGRNKLINYQSSPQEQRFGLSGSDLCEKEVTGERRGLREKKKGTPQTYERHPHVNSLHQKSHQVSVVLRTGEGGRLRDRRRAKHVDRIKGEREIISLKNKMAQKKRGEGGIAAKVARTGRESNVSAGNPTVAMVTVTPEKKGVKKLRGEQGGADKRRVRCRRIVDRITRNPTRSGIDLPCSTLIERPEQAIEGNETKNPKRR